MDLSNLDTTQVWIADGAMGTELQRAGLAIGESGERWVLEHADRLEAIHRAYLEAGSQFFIANSFGANRWVLERYGLADRLEEINREAVAIASRVAAGRAAVLGDIGPCGGFLRPLGPIDPADLQAEFTRQARAQLEGGADGLIIETMSAIEEVALAIRGAKAAGARFLIASLAFDRLPNGAIRTMMGVSPEQAARAAEAEGAHVIGANCGTRMSPADFADVVKAFRAASRKPVMIQANAGSPVLEDGRAVYHLDPDAFAEGMRQVIAAGAHIVGGCCGTTPAHIAALARMSRSQPMGQR
jgi:5-methyltetrahydrofolate--homocysteine methyltransferase